MGIGALLANPVALAITGAVLAVGALGIAIVDLNENPNRHKMIWISLDKE